MKYLTEKGLMFGLLLYVILHFAEHTAADKEQIILTGHALNHRMNRTEAIKKCQKFGRTWGLVSDRSRSENDIIKKFMAKYAMNSTWLSLQKEIFKSWKWTNGTNYTDPSIGQDHNCAFLQVSSGATRNANCVESSKRGYICQLNGNTCPKGLSSHITTCVIQEMKAYLLGCAASNWYSARYTCSQFGGQLALCNQKIEAFNYLASCVDPWIGTHKEDWYHVMPGHEPERQTVAEPFWLPDMDTASYKISEYAVMKATNAGYYWQAAAAEEEHSVICQNYQTAKTDHTKPQQAEKDVESNSTMTCRNSSRGLTQGGTAAIVLAVIIVITSLVVCFVLVWKRIISCSRNPV